MAKQTEDKEENVSFIEEDGDTVVDFTEKDESKPDPVHERLARAEEETARLRSEIHQSRQQQYNLPPQNQKDYIDTELESVHERERALGIQWEMDRAAGRLRDKSVTDDYDRKAREIEAQKATIASRKAMRDMLPQLAREQQAMQIRQQHADVFANQAALSYAQGVYQMMVARNPEQDGPQMLDRAMNEARVEFRMPNANYNKPSQSDKNRLSGVPGGGGRNIVDNRVKMGKPEKQMAEAMFLKAAGGKQEKAWEMWAKKIGIKAKKNANKQRNT